MRNRTLFSMMAVLGAALVSSQANASITITQQNAPAPTYSTTLDFDEVGGPTGAVVGDEWQSLGLTELVSGTGVQSVGDNSVIEAWLPSDNTFNAPFGAFMTFDSDLTEMSFQGWDNGGPPGPFGGGALVAVLDDGVEVGSSFVQPAFGGFGDSWFNITTSGGMVFDEVRFLGFAFIPQTYVDNLSWNAVPEPSSLALLAMSVVGVAIRRRR